MTAPISYEKYTQMNKRQLLNQLINAEKKDKKIRQNLLESGELIKFLKAELKARIDKPHYDFAPLEQTAIYKDIKKYEATLSPAELTEIDREIEADINRDYGDEL